MSFSRALRISRTRKEVGKRAQAIMEEIHSKETGDGKSVFVTETNLRSAIDRADSSDGTSYMSSLPKGSKSSFRLPSSRTLRKVFLKYLTFVGPGFMVAVSYIDPGNYSTDVAAGANYRFHHLFIIFMSSMFAIFLQCLAIKLGSITGTDLATNCKRHLPKYLNWLIYFLAESAIIATDLAEVLGTAIALKILIKVPLPAGVALTMVDVIVILYLYRPNGPIKIFHYFEIGIACLVFGVVVCFCLQLAKLTDTSPDEVMLGYIPSKPAWTGSGLYLSCGILGATVMPHSLYLGTDIVRPRLQEYDKKKGYFHPETEQDFENYRPSLQAIKSTMRYAMADLGLSLGTIALFVNSAILIVAGATLSTNPDAANADLFSIHDLLSQSIGPAAGILFALALLFSGQSAGIVVTLAGQIVAEGHLDWKITPWIRRLVTRAIAVAPCIAVASSLGRDGINQALNASQVTLSILLPFLTGPLVWFTCNPKYMKAKLHTQIGEPEQIFQYANNKWTCAAAMGIWGFIAGLNAYLVVSLAMGKGS